MDSKICLGCHEEKPLTDFASKKGSRNGLQTKCRKCHSKYSKKHYQRNKDRYLERNKKHRQQMQDFVRALKERPCMDCGQHYPWFVMDFDHREDEDKVINVSQMLGYSEKQIREEIAKCDLVCANCHRYRTFKRASVA